MADSVDELAAEIETEITKHFGPVLSGENLYRSLGYPSMSALRQALHRQNVPVTVFTIPNRAGRFALTRDVARCLASWRIAADGQRTQQNGGR